MYSHARYELCIVGSSGENQKFRREGGGHPPPSYVIMTNRFSMNIILQQKWVIFWNKMNYRWRKMNYILEQNELSFRTKNKRCLERNKLVLKIKSFWSEKVWKGLPIVFVTNGLWICWNKFGNKIENKTNLQSVFVRKCVKRFLSKIKVPKNWKQNWKRDFSILHTFPLVPLAPVLP